MAKFEDDPCHPKAIRTLWDMMDQAQKLEKEQKFTNIQEAEKPNQIMNQIGETKISTRNGKTKEDTTATITEMVIRSPSLKSQKRINMRRGSNNKTSYGKYSKEEVADLIETTIKCIMQQNLQKDVNKIKS